MSKSEKWPPNSPAGDTVFALSSARGRAGVAVVRVSGPGAGAAIEALTDHRPAAPRTAALRELRDPASGEAIDRGLVLWFPAPASATGEDVAEFHVHGSRAVLDFLLSALAALPGLAPAPAGAFTRRAFDNGKLDLTEVEGLADLIDAETEAQRRQALRQMAGALGALYEGWREGLVRSLAHVEAAIDFPDEAVPADLIDQVRPALDRLAGAIRAHLDDDHRGELLRDGFSVAIVGAPNAGKSSFLNAVARREVAIVSSAAGTTRDVIEVRIDLGGYPVLLADTAGLREAVDSEAHGAPVDPVEAEGMRRALARAEQADLKIVVIDGTAAGQKAALALIDDRSLVVVNKCDRAGFSVPVGLAGRGATPISATRGDGIDAALKTLAAAAEAGMSLSPTPALTRARHRDALVRCVAALDRARAAEAGELLAEDLRLAVRALGELVGKVDVEALLDVVFRDFCIGK